MKSSRSIASLCVLLATLLLSGCGYNDFQRLDEQVKAGWCRGAEPVPAPRRPDPEHRRTVKGEANFEQETLTKVIEARAKATSIQATPETDQRPGGVPEIPGRAGRAVERVEPADGDGRALPRPEGQRRASRTCACSSKAPRTASPWRATATSRRCSDYNVLARSFPTNLTAMVFNYDVKPSFTVAERSRHQRAADAWTSATHPPHRRPGEPRNRRAPEQRRCARWRTFWLALWLAAGCLAAMCAGRAAGAGADGARHRPDRHARRRAAQRARGQAGRLRGQAGPADRRADGADHAARGHRRATPSASADSWKIGRSEVGDGVLLVVAKNDRRVRIEVAKTLEGAIPDLAARQIIDRRHHAGVPRRRLRRRACSAGVDQLIARIKGEALPAPQAAGADGSAGGGFALAGTGDLLLRRRAGARRAC